jgi:hypothetical protein
LPWLIQKVLLFTITKTDDTLAVSTWKNMKHADGYPVFVDTYSLEPKSHKQVADISDGYAPPLPGESHLLRMLLKKSFLTLTVDGWSVLANDGGRITLNFYNTNNVTAPVVGTVIRPESFKMDVFVYPYKNGWLIYGATAVKIEKIGDMYRPEMISNIMASLFNWLVVSTAR